MSSDNPTPPNATRPAQRNAQRQTEPLAPGPPEREPAAPAAPAPETSPTTWWLDRAREPSTYQGLCVLAGLLGGWLFHSPEAGRTALEIGLAIASVIQVGKAEPLKGRDY